MRVIPHFEKASRLLQSLLLFLFIIGSLSLINAQSANLKANIRMGEFTAKGAGLQEGSSVSDISFNDVNSKKFKLFSRLNKMTVLVFYSLSDADIAKKTKYLKIFYKQYNINIIGITKDEYPNRIRKYVSANKLDWPNVQDDSEKFGGKSFADSQNIPNAQFVLIAPNKKVFKVIPKGKPIGMLGAVLQKYFK